MRYTLNFPKLITIIVCLTALASTTFAFEGRIQAVTIRGSETNGWLYTVATNAIRVEVTTGNQPSPVDILDLNSGSLTLIFPQNRSFVRLAPLSETATGTTPGMPGMPAIPAMPPRPAIPQMPARQPMPVMPMPGMTNMPALPPGIGPQPRATAGAGVPVMPGGPSLAMRRPGMTAIPGWPTAPNSPGMSMPMMPSTDTEFHATGEKTNLLGLACEHFEFKQHGATLEVWATDRLLPYQPYLQNQPHRFGHQGIEEQWPALLTNRKLFPLLVTLHRDNGPERFHFEVKSVTPQALTEADTKLFQTPDGYFEIQPLPF